MNILVACFIVKLFETRTNVNKVGEGSWCLSKTTDVLACSQRKEDSVVF